jgi:GLPGLI family protein
MRKIFLAASLVMIAGATQAQQKEGKVTYERTAQMQIQVAGNDRDAISQMLPKSMTDKFELSFGNNRSLWRHAEEEVQNNDFNNNGMQIRMMGAGNDDISFCDFAAGQKVEQREFFDKKFIVTDSIKQLNWKIGGDTKIILGHVCQKATAARTGKRTQMTMENGNMERKEINDTTLIVAWFTTDIPVPAGPEVQGQLPGLILALDMNNGRVVYQALEISPKVDLASIKEPTKGKKVTPDQFLVERNKMMEDMQKNNQGRGDRVIRMN